MFTRYGFMPFFIICFMTMFLTMGPVFGQLPTEVEETELSLTLNQLPGANLTMGGGAAVPLPNGFVAGIFQSNGTVIRGRGYAEYGFDANFARIVPYVATTFKGNDWDALGTQHDGGLNFEFEEVVEGVDISGGVFGRSGGAFAKPNLFDLAAANGYDENTLEGYANPDGKTLAELNPAPTGLSFGDKNSLNLLFQADFNVKDIGVAVKVMPELANDSDAEATDQAIINLNSSYVLGEKVRLGIGADIGFQRFRDSGDLEKQIAGFTTINLSF